MASNTFQVKRLRRELWEANISMREVAERANVSRVTASNVINGHYINIEVVQAAQELLKESKQ